MTSPSNAAPSAIQLYTSTGGLRELTTSTSVYTPADLTNDTTETDVSLVPLWTEKQGGGGATVTMQDSLTNDGWGRLVQAHYYKNGTAFATDSFSFDVAGNVTPNGETRTYDPATNRLTVRAGDSLAYDAAGNLTSRKLAGSGTWTYTYDPLERLVAARYNGTVVARYGYDVLGRRIMKYVTGVGSLRMIYRGGSVIAESDYSGTLLLSYTWGLGDDDLVAVHRYSDGGHWYVVQDQLRSVRELVSRDGSATWQASWRYHVYGAVLDSAGTAPLALRYQWIGREYDAETGLYYVRARYYDPAAQRFMQEDPGGYTTSSNLYAYGEGNPTAGRDLNGQVMDYELTATPPDIQALIASFGCWTSECSGVGTSSAGGWMEQNDEMWDQTYSDVTGGLLQGCGHRDCGSAVKIMSDRGVQALFRQLMKDTNYDLHERGTWLIEVNGQIMYTPIVVAPGTQWVDLGLAPENAIAAVHTHGDILPGIQPGGGPSLGDQENARTEPYHRFILSSVTIYYYDYYQRWWDSRSWWGAPPPNWPPRH